MELVMYSILSEYSTEILVLHTNRCLAAQIG
jgi:hypothetical protein